MQQRSYFWLFGCTFVLLLAMIKDVPVCGQVKNESKPKITISNVPTNAPGDDFAKDPIRGTVSGVKFQEHKVVVYARGGDVWYIQPWSHPKCYVGIDDDGKWQTRTRGGTEFAALLVKPSFKPEEKLGSEPEPGGDVLAVAYTEKKTTK